MNYMQSQVPDEEVHKWVAAAHSGRIAQYILEQEIDPTPGSPLATDDAAYKWEKCSAWIRSYLQAAADHLVLWANIISPQQVFEGQTVKNPPRPYHTLARAALESSAQAVWILEQEDTSERVHRHLRLLYHDLRQLALTLEADGSEQAVHVRERMQKIENRVSNRYDFDSIKKAEPKYLTMIRDTANYIDCTPEGLEVVWRSASAAAHGKNWFQTVGYNTEIESEYEPGYFRVQGHPDAASITRAAEAASAMTMRGVLQFALLSRINIENVIQTAMTRLMNETPLKPGANFPEPPGFGPK